MDAEHVRSVVASQSSSHPKPMGTVVHCRRGSTRNGVTTMCSVELPCGPERENDIAREGIYGDVTCAECLRALEARP